MTWVVDTCVILDILDGKSAFTEASSSALQSKLDDALLIAPISYVELAPAFNGDASAQNIFLDHICVHRDFNASEDSVLAAHKAWYDHIMRKRRGKIAKRPIADVLIGAYAMQKGGLITRNEDDFRSLYPALNIFNPAKANI